MSSTVEVGGARFDVPVTAVLGFEFGAQSRGRRARATGGKSDLHPNVPRCKAQKDTLVDQIASKNSDNAINPYDIQRSMPRTEPTRP